MERVGMMASRKNQKKRPDEPLSIEQYAKKLSYRPQRLVEAQRCGRCASRVDGQDANFCPVCGDSEFVGGKVSEMVYKKIRLNENGKAVICPHCSNEELTPGDFCIICGSGIINHCADAVDEDGKLIKTGCQTLLPGNARYCYKCGNAGTFYHRGWLKDWRSENTRKAIENINIAVDYDELRSNRSSG